MTGDLASNKFISGCLKPALLCILIGCLHGIATGQAVQKTTDKLIVNNGSVKITLDKRTGKINYLFAGGTALNNTSAYINEAKTGHINSTYFTSHSYTIETVKAPLGKAMHIRFIHEDDKISFRFIQHITIYQNQPYLLISVTAEGRKAQSQLKSNDIAPLAMLPSQQGKLLVTGSEPRILDLPFDNDNWVNILERKWPVNSAERVEGSSYEYAAVYDNTSMSGIVIGSVSHDFWKTGISYKAGVNEGTVDSLVVFGGIATPDNPVLPPAYGGYDGTHDHTAHGSMTGSTITSPVIYINAGGDVRKAFQKYGEVNAGIAGSLQWKGFAPFYWNSFGVEDVLGYRNTMLPPGVDSISDFIKTLDHFNSYGKPVISIDSYDQGIYSTRVLADIGKHAKQNKQQIGFYFIPFAIWTWKDGMESNKLPGSEYVLQEVVLKDKNGQPIAYKDGNFGAFPIDPTHPATRLYIINQLQKAKAIGASFLKIDFLTAGSLESTQRFDPTARSGMQAYNRGMKLLKSLADSILGPDVFITMAISPMFPHQYAHTRFLSTDVYSHLRNDQPGFPALGSTQASLSAGTHLGWVQGTLWPYTNLDISIMKNFQRNPDLTQQEIKVRIYAMMAMGSVFGDGSDFRNQLAAERAHVFLDNKNVCDFFSSPKAFVPLNFSDGETMNQQLSFFLPGKTPLLSMFNFDTTKSFSKSFSRKMLGLNNQTYELRDFMSNALIDVFKKDDTDIKLTVASKDALLIRLVRGK